MPYDSSRQWCRVNFLTNGKVMVEVRQYETDRNYRNGDYTSHSYPVTVGEHVFSTDEQAMKFIDWFWGTARKPIVL